MFSFRTAEEIKVLIKPWIRIDGALNRKVLDRMLGAILNYCLLHPGLTMSKVQSRFVPALQPFHTRELLEVHFIDCLYILIKPYFWIIERFVLLDLIYYISLNINITKFLLQLIDKNILLILFLILLSSTKSLFLIKINFSFQMLIKLGCLESKLLKKTRVSLFSPPPVINISDLSM